MTIYVKRPLSFLSPARTAGACLLALTVASSTLYAQQCRTFSAGEEVAQLEDARIDEASGLAASWKNDDIFWVHNDSGGEARVFAVDRSGSTKTVVTLPDVDARDFEDMAVGPCAPDDTTPCVWLGDIGDNNSVRESVSLHRFIEPELGDAPPAEMIADDVRTITVTYADGSRDAEALMVHPTDGRVFIIDKTPGDPSNIWLVPTHSDAVTATLAASVELGEIGVIGGRITGGDFAPGGDEFSIRTYAVVYTFCGRDPMTAFSREPSRVIGFDLFQSESLTYSRDGDALWTTSEVRSSEKPPLVRMELKSSAGPLDPPDPQPADVGGSEPPDDQQPTDDTGSKVGGDSPTERAENTPGCSCGVTKKAGSPWGTGLLLLLLVITRRRPPGRCRETSPS